MRFYGFRPEELTGGETGDDRGMLSLQVDPKLGWALRNRSYFPIDLNRASRERLLRTPGIGAKTVRKLLQIRRWQKVRLADLVALRADVKKAMPFVVCADHHPGVKEASSEILRARYSAAPEQLGLDLGR